MLARTTTYSFFFRLSITIVVFLALVSFGHYLHIIPIDFFTAEIIGFLLFVIIFILAIQTYFDYSYVNTEKERSLLFEALNLHTRFWFIADRSGNIVYSNDVFKSLFPNATKFIHLLDESMMLTSDKEKLIHAFHSNENSVIPFQYQQSQTLTNKTSKAKLYLMHMQKPSGYSLFYTPQKILSNDYKVSLDHIITASYLLSKDGKVTYMNDACLKLLGYKSFDELNNKLSSFTNLLSNKNTTNSIDEFSTTDQWKGMLSFNTPKYKNLNCYVEQYTDHKSNCKHGIIMPATYENAPTLSADITKNAWNVFLKDSPMASVTITSKGDIIQRNTSFDVLTDTSQLDKNFNIFDIVAPDQKDDFTSYFQKLSNDNYPNKPLAISFQPRNQKSAELHIVQLPKSKKRSSKSPAYICHLIDITEQRSLEERFAHSQRMQAIGQLAGGIAHDFNNLLTAIIGFCDLLLLRHPAGDRSFSDIMQIKQNSTRAANLVRQLLAFSRKQTLQPEVIHITDVLSEISHLIRRLIGENIELVMNHGRNIGKTKVDQGQFEQVIINLAVNARDAISERGTLTIETKNITVASDTVIDKDMIAPDGARDIVPGNYIRLDITDTGCGIPKNKIEQVFEPFFTTKEVGSGTGLGLSTVYGIVNQTEGYIFVKSEANQGTTFTIFLKSHDEETTTTTKTDEDIGDSTDLTGKETILLVEDEAPVRAFSTQALSNKGYNVLDADSGTTALEIAKAHVDEIDLIITDVMMPGMNGPTMIKEIHKLNPNIQVIFISGYAEDAFISSYGSDRDFHFLPKPFTLKQLALKVKEVLVEKKK